jgi:hypothetical protein
MKTTAEKFLARNSTPGAIEDQRSGPLFVVGMWRSGTSLLYALLNQHPDIGLMYEDDLWLLWPMFLGGKAKQDWFERWNFWNGGPQRHRLDASLFPARPNLKAAVESAYKSAGTLVWGAKSPNYYDAMTSLAREFPAARFIIIWRDLHGICRSIVRAASKPSWFTRAGMIDRTIVGYRQMKLHRDRLVNAGILVHEIHYENLVSDPENTMCGICHFLQISFDPKMCSLRDADRSAVFDHDHHELVNSSEIVSSQHRPEVLSGETVNKIARYTAFWKKQDGGQWPVFAGDVAGQNVPSRFERAKDFLFYRALRAYDLGIVLVYCYAPLFLLRRYRAMKRPPAPVATQGVKEAA